LGDLWRVQLVGLRSVMRMMDGISSMMAGMGLIWFLVIIVLVLGIAALMKYLRR
jgi:hypothetical protein